MLENFTILFVLQMTISCLINTAVNVVPNTWFELIKLSFLPFSIYNAVECSTKHDSGLIDDIEW
jgi:hypothetical protein